MSQGSWRCTISPLWRFNLAFYFITLHVAMSRLSFIAQTASRISIPWGTSNLFTRDQYLFFMCALKSVIVALENCGYCLDSWIHDNIDYLSLCFYCILIYILKGPSWRFVSRSYGDMPFSWWYWHWKRFFGHLAPLTNWSWSIAAAFMVLGHF